MQVPKWRTLRFHLVLIDQVPPELLRAAVPVEGGWRLVMAQLVFDERFDMLPAEFCGFQRHTAVDEEPDQRPHAGLAGALRLDRLVLRMEMAERGPKVGFDIGGAG